MNTFNENPSCLLAADGRPDSAAAQTGVDRLRRAACALGVAGAVLGPRAWAAPYAGVGPDEIVLGQILAVTGPLAAIIPDIINATQAWFDHVNRQGGIHGRKVRVVTADDGYVAANSPKAARELIDKEQVFAILNMSGTANVAAILPLLAKEDPPVPFFGPITGAQVLREPLMRNVFHLRASYADEAEKLVQHLHTVNLRKISALYLDNGFGKDGLEGVQKAMAARGSQLQAAVPVRQDAADVDEAVERLVGTDQNVIVMVTTGRATVDFIKKFNQRRKGVQFYTLSVMGAQATIQALGPDGVGVVVASVVPFPWNQALPVANEYRAAMKRAGHANLSFMGFEAFLNAKAVTEGLQRAGRDLTRQRCVSALEGMQRIDLGGFEFGFSPKSHEGSRFVELTIIGSNGRFMK